VSERETVAVVVPVDPAVFVAPPVCVVVAPEEIIELIVLLVVITTVLPEAEIRLTPPLLSVEIERPLLKNDDDVGDVNDSPLPVEENAELLDVLAPFGFDSAETLPDPENVDVCAFICDVTMEYRLDLVLVPADVLGRVRLKFPNRIVAFCVTPPAAAFPLANAFVVSELSDCDGDSVLEKSVLLETLKLPLPEPDPVTRFELLLDEVEKDWTALVS
jgi:hypothetical protein